MTENPAKSFLLAAALAALATPSFGWEWREDWKMPGEVYKTLGFSVRAGIDRATRSFSKGVGAYLNPAVSVQDRISAFRLAGAEWRKVQVQSESGDFDERVLSYALFMQGCSSEMAKDSNAAVKMYSEVLELYPDMQWVAVPAKLRLGLLQLDMGEGRRADATLAELLADPAARNTPFRADALIAAGDRMWDAGKFAEADKAWREVLSDDVKCVGQDRRNAACGRLIPVAMAKGDYAAMEGFFMANREDNDEQRLQAVRDVIGRASLVMRGNLDHYGVSARLRALYPSEPDRKKRLGQTKKDLFPWFASKRGLYEAAGRTESFLLDSLDIALLSGSEGQVASALKSVESLLRTAKTPEKVAGRAKDILCSARKYDLARKMPDYVKDPLAASWMRYQIESSAGKHAAALVHLEEYLARKPPASSERAAKYAIAQICRDHLAKYDRAIAIFQELNDPPKTLWDLHDAYRKAGRKKESYQMLSEIESMFPSDAPRAVWTHAQCLEQDGDKKHAIALYRRLLSQPEWKRTQEASWAHQALERHGVATGGAVVNEVR